MVVAWLNRLRKLFQRSGTDPVGPILSGGPTCDTFKCFSNDDDELVGCTAR